MWIRLHQLYERHKHKRLTVGGHPTFYIQSTASASAS